MNEEIEIKEKLKRTCCKFHLNNGNRQVKVNITKKLKIQKDGLTSYIIFLSYLSSL